MINLLYASGPTFDWAIVLCILYLTIVGFTIAWYVKTWKMTGDIKKIRMLLENKLNEKKEP